MAKATEAHPYRRTRTLMSSPAELMLVLDNAAISLCKQAKTRIALKDFDDAHARLAKAENIVMELCWGLRRDGRPELVDEVCRLFEFVFYRLFEANVSHNPRCIDEAVSVLSGLRDTWVQAIEKAGQEIARAVGADPRVRPRTRADT